MTAPAQQSGATSITQPFCEGVVGQHWEMEERRSPTYQCLLRLETEAGKEGNEKLNRAKVVERQSLGKTQLCLAFAAQFSLPCKEFIFKTFLWSEI